MCSTTACHLAQFRTELSLANEYMACVPAINNLSCLFDNAQSIAMTPGAVAGIVRMLRSSTEEAQQCGALALAK